MHQLLFIEAKRRLAHSAAQQKVLGERQDGMHTFTVLWRVSVLLPGRVHAGLIHYPQGAHLHPWNWPPGQVCNERSAVQVTRRKLMGEQLSLNLGIF